MRISDWSSDVCSSDLGKFDFVLISGEKQERRLLELNLIRPGDYAFQGYPKFELVAKMAARPLRLFDNDRPTVIYNPHFDPEFSSWPLVGMDVLDFFARRSEEHTSELQSLMRISYAVFC